MQDRNHSLRETILEISILLSLGRVLSVVPRGKVSSVVPLTDGLELLGMKWLPCLTATQAKEVTPYEAGDRLWKDNVHTLTTGRNFFLIIHVSNMS